jgi:hypothetical protein
MAERPDPPQQNPGPRQPLSSEEVIRRIVLELQSVVRGQREAQQYFSSTLQGLNQVQRAAARHNAVLARTQANFARFFHAGTAIGRTLKSISIPFAVLTGAVSGLHAVMAPIIRDMDEYGSLFNRVAIATGRGQKSVENLVGAYRELHANSQMMLLDIKTLGEDLMKYASMGFVEFASSAEKNVAKGVGVVENALAGIGHKDTYLRAMADLGRNGGSVMVRNLTREMGQLDANDFGAMLGVIDKYLANMGQSGFQLAEAIQRAADAEKGLLDPLSQLNAEWIKAGAGIRASMDELKRAIWEALGPAAVKLVRDLNGILMELKTWFEDTDTVAKFAQIAQNGFVLVTKALALLGGTAADVFGIMAQGFGATGKYLGKLSGWDGLEEGGAALQDLGEQASKAGRKFAGISGRLKLKSFEKVKNYIRNAKEEQKKFTDRVAAGHTEAEKSAKAFSDLLKNATVLTEEAKQLEQHLTRVSGAADAFAEILKVAGGIPELESALAKSGADMMDVFNKRTDVAAEAMKQLQLALQMARQQRDAAKTDDDRRAALASISAVMEKIQQVQKDNLGTALAIAKQAEQQTAPMDRQLDFASRALQLIRQQKEAYSLIMGVPGMGLEAIKQEYQMLQQTVGILEAKKQANKAAYDARIQQIDEEIAAATDLQTIEAKKIQRQILVNKQLENQQGLQREILDTQLQQLRATKELREGYLNAISAMALGAGKFEKFIIKQERNTGRGMRMGMARKTPLLGEVGKEAAVAPRLGPTRWSGTEFGALEDMRGQNVNFDQLKNFSDSIAGRMTDDLAKILMQGSTNLMSQMRDTGGKTNELLERILDKMDGGLPGVGGMAGRASNFAPQFQGLDPAAMRFMGGRDAGAMFNVPGFRGYKTGGYTGSGPADQPAGVVHKGEVVFEKSVVDKYKPTILAMREQMQRGETPLPGYKEGGLVKEADKETVRKIKESIQSKTALPGYKEGGLVKETDKETVREIKSIQTKFIPQAEFKVGGFTGRGSASEPAGIVHKGEIVFEKKIVDKYGPSLLSLRDQMQRGEDIPGFERGGQVGRRRAFRHGLLSPFQEPNLPLTQRRRVRAKKQPYVMGPYAKPPVREKVEVPQTKQEPQIKLRTRQTDARRMMPAGRIPDPFFDQVRDYERSRIKRPEILPQPVAQQIPANQYKDPSLRELKERRKRSVAEHLKEYGGSMPEGYTLALPFFAGTGVYAAIKHRKLIAKGYRGIRGAVGRLGRGSTPRTPTPPAPPTGPSLGGMSRTTRGIQEAQNAAKQRIELDRLKPRKYDAGYERDVRERLGRSHLQRRVSEPKLPQKGRLVDESFIKDVENRLARSHLDKGRRAARLQRPERARLFQPLSQEELKSLKAQRAAAGKPFKMPTVQQEQMRYIKLARSRQANAWQRVAEARVGRVGKAGGVTLDAMEPVAKAGGAIRESSAPGRLGRPGRALAKTRAAGKAIRVGGPVLAAAGAGLSAYETYQSYKQGGMDERTAYRGAQTAADTAAAIFGGPLAWGAAVAMHGSEYIEKWLSGRDTFALDELADARAELSRTLEESKGFSDHMAELGARFRQTGDIVRALDAEISRARIEESTRRTKLGDLKDRVFGEWGSGFEADELRRGIKDYEDIAHRKRQQLEKVLDVDNVWEQMKTQSKRKGAAEPTFEEAMQEARRRYDIERYMKPVIGEAAQSLETQYKLSPDVLQGLRAMRESTHLRMLQMKPQPEMAPKDDQAYQRESAYLKMIEGYIEDEKKARGITEAEQELPKTAAEAMSKMIPSVFDALPDRQKSPTTEDFDNNVKQLRTTMNEFVKQQFETYKGDPGAKAAFEEKRTEYQRQINQFMDQIVAAPPEQREALTQNLQQTLEDNVGKMGLDDAAQKALKDSLGKFSQSIAALKTQSLESAPMFQQVGLDAAIQDLERQKPQNTVEAIQRAQQLKGLRQQRQEMGDLKDIPLPTEHFTALNAINDRLKSLDVKMAGDEELIAAKKKELAEKGGQLDPATRKLLEEQVALLQRNVDYARQQYGAIVDQQAEKTKQSAREIYSLQNLPVAEKGVTDEGVASFVQERLKVDMTGADQNFVDQIQRGLANLATAQAQARKLKETSQVDIKLLEDQLKSATTTPQREQIQQQIDSRKAQFDAATEREAYLEQQIKVRSTTRSMPELEKHLADLRDQIRNYTNMGEEGGAPEKLRQAQQELRATQQVMIEAGARPTLPTAAPSEDEQALARRDKYYRDVQAGKDALAKIRAEKKAATGEKRTELAQKEQEQLRANADLAMQRPEIERAAARAGIRIKKQKAPDADTQLSGFDKAYNEILAAQASGKVLTDADQNVIKAAQDAARYQKVELEAQAARLQAEFAQSHKDRTGRELDTRALEFGVDLEQLAGGDKGKLAEFKRVREQFRTRYKTPLAQVENSLAAVNQVLQGKEITAASGLSPEASLDLLDRQDLERRKDFASWQSQYKLTPEDLTRSAPVTADEIAKATGDKRLKLQGIKAYQTKFRDELFDAKSARESLRPLLGATALDAQAQRAQTDMNRTPPVPSSGPGIPPTGAQPPQAANPPSPPSGGTGGAGGPTPSPTTANSSALAALLRAAADNLEKASEVVSRDQQPGAASGKRNVASGGPAL